MPLLALRPRVDEALGDAGERGQVLILSVLFMTVIFMLGVFVVDLGLWVSERRVAQTDADMAAMAGAVELGTNGSTNAVAKAQEWATKNGYTQGVDGATVIVNYPYNGNSLKIEVEVSKPSPLLFGSIFSLAGFDIGARAVGTALSQNVTYAIFANANDCGTSVNDIDFSGGGVTVTGAVHTNGQFFMSGTGNTHVGPVTDNCTRQDNSNWQPTHPADIPRPYPVSASFLDFASQAPYSPAVSLNGAIATTSATTFSVMWTGGGNDPIKAGQTIVVGSEPMLVTAAPSGASPQNVTVTRGYWVNGDGSASATTHGNGAAVNSVQTPFSPGVTLGGAITAGATTFAVSWSGGGNDPVAVGNAIWVEGEAMLVLTKSGANNVSPQNLTVNRGYAGTAAAHAGGLAVTKAPCDYWSPSDWSIQNNPAPWWDSGNKVLLPGVYCSEGNISASSQICGTTGQSCSRTPSGDCTSAGVTFVARGTVQFSTPNTKLDPYKMINGNCFFIYTQSTNSSAAKTSSNVQWAQIIYAPNGTADITGPASIALKGSVVANKVKISGSNWSLLGVVSSLGSSAPVALIE